MDCLFTFIFALFLTTCAGTGQFYSHLENGKRATVEHIVSPHQRDVRETKNPHSIFKEYMHFAITLEGGEHINLRLKLNKDQLGRVLVKVVSKDGTEFFDNTKPRDYRFYQVIGEDHGASVMVKCENFKAPCHIAGSFYHNSKEYLIDPETDSAHVVSVIPHTVYEVTPGTRKPVYDHDTVPVAAGTSQGKRQGPAKELKKLMKKIKSPKSKREVTRKNYKIEIEMLVDNTIYDYWYARLGNDHDAAMLKIEQYMEQVANNMDLRFSTAVSDTMEIDIVPILITVIKDQVNNTWLINNVVGVNSDGVQAINAEQSLTDLYYWGLDNKNSRADALISFTRLDLWSGGQLGGEGTIGIARYPVDNLQDKNPLSGLCTGNAVSINEIFRHGDASATASHELAHNMGISHDGTYQDSACLDDDMYIMSRTLGFVSSAADAKNPWSFSACSIREMERLMSTVPRDSNGMTCLEQHSYDVGDYNRIRTSDLLGELYSTDEQCSILEGSGSVHCDGTSIRDEDICWRGIPCSDSGLSCIVKFALSGSSCGGTKKCYQGECVETLPEIVTEPVSSAPSNSTTTTTTTTTTTRPTTSTSTSTPTTTSTQSPTSTSSTTRAQSTSTTTKQPASTTQSTTSTTQSTTSTTQSTTSTTQSTTSTTESTTQGNVYTANEIDWLRFFSRACSYCNCCSCWRFYCWRYGKISLCQRFADVCYA